MSSTPAGIPPEVVSAFLRSEHTPLPWEENKDEQHYLPNEPIRIGWVDEGKFHEVCELADTLHEAGNAELIVRAVNSYSVMLKALEGISRNAALDDAWLAPVRAAVAKATGKEG